jgi:hypothetical protein
MSRFGCHKNPEGVAGYMLTGYGKDRALTLATERFMAAKTNPFWYEVCLVLLKDDPR